MAVILAVGAFTLVVGMRAGRHAVQAKAALLRAEQDLSGGNLDAARQDLVTARSSLAGVRAQLDHLGPILPVSKAIPMVRSQVIAVETFQSAGTTLADAGLRLADATQRVRESTAANTPLSELLDDMRTIDASLGTGAESIRVASTEVNHLKGKWLIGPIGTVRDELLTRLPRYEKQATATSEGLKALIGFAGGSGPRRYLLLSQNPDEIRPTGGFIGTYGTLSADESGLSLGHFVSITTFLGDHPNATVPGANAGSPFRLGTPPFPQSLANVNNVPDFSQSGKLAAEIWNAAGEPHVDGVVSFTPAFLARILGVLGPVRVEDFGETVDQTNLVDRFDFYTAQLDVDANAATTRKAFVSSLADVVMQRLLAAPSSQWQALATAMGQSFATREAMAWSSDPQVEATIVTRGWDAALPKASGDFFYDAEFSYLAKIDRRLQRTFDHHVQLRADGSALITTTMTLANNHDPGDLNPGSLSYVTFYGPEGAVLDPSSDKAASSEPAVAGHPAAGWFVNAEPHGKATLRVVWNVKGVVQKGPHGARQYSLTWLRIPDHTGDVLNLRVDLPPGWTWDGPGPSSHFDLDKDAKGTWTMVPGKT